MRNVVFLITFNVYCSSYITCSTHKCRVDWPSKPRQHCSLQTRKPSFDNGTIVNLAASPGNIFSPDSVLGML